MSKEISLILTEDQARVVSRACEFYCRVYLGQFQEIPFELMITQSMSDADWCYRRDEAEKKLLEAREFIYPELHGIGHSYGVGKFEVADKAWNAYQVLRYALGDERRPYAFYGEKLPVCKVSETDDGK